MVSPCSSKPFFLTLLIIDLIQRLLQMTTTGCGLSWSSFQLSCHGLHSLKFQECSHRLSSLLNQGAVTAAPYRWAVGAAVRCAGEAGFPVQQDGQQVSRVGLRFKCTKSMLQDSPARRQFPAKYFCQICSSGNKILLVSVFKNWNVLDFWI